MIEQLRENTQLQILNEFEQEYYLATIKEAGKDSFTILEPISGGKTLDMPQYSSWQFCLPGEDAVYFFTARIVGVSKEGGETAYVVKKPDSAHRQQRRGHVRVPCHHNLIYWNWDKTAVKGLPSPAIATRSSDLWEDPIWMKDYLRNLEKRVAGKNSFTLDMSGGGLRMVTLEPLERQEHLFIKLTLDEQRSRQVLLLEAKVVRVVPLNIGGWKRYRIGVSFVNLDLKVQERIISYLFKLMRKKL